MERAEMSLSLQNQPPVPSQGASHLLPAAAFSFIKSLGQTIKAFSLYPADHPVTAALLGEAFKTFDYLLRFSSGREITLAVLDGRWLCEGVPVAGADQGAEILLAFFRSWGVQSLTFLGDVRFSELSALCQEAARPCLIPVPAALVRALVQKGVQRIKINGEFYAKARQEPAPPVPPAPPPPPPAKRPARNFSSMLKELVESATGDSEERVRLYGDAVALVKEALDRAAADSHVALQREKQRVMTEQSRTERVLSSVSEGKVIVDREGRVLMMNQAAEEISGKRLAELAGRPLAEGAAGEGHMVALTGDLDLQEGGSLSNQVRVLAEEEVQRALKRSLALVHDEAGRIVGTYAVLPEVQKFKEAKRMQEEFLARVTHDLKAPLSSICMALELVSASAATRLTQEEGGYISVCLKNSRKLSDMILHILDFSKLESGQIDLRTGPVAAEDIVREAVESLTPWAQTRQISLTAQLSAARLPWIQADGERIVQVLANLVSNALKATPEGGRVTVGAGLEASRPGFLVFSVRDTGRGIAPPDQERIFEDFVQAPAQGERAEGVGLGLSIVRELVSLHGGAVWLDSEPGRGALFSFSIPLAADAPAQTGRP